MTSLTPVTAARTTETPARKRRSVVRALIKWTAKRVGSVLAWPYLMRYAMLGAVIGKQQAFSAVSERVARIPAPLGIYVRQGFYRRTLSGQVGRDVYIGFMTVMSKPHAAIGDEVYVGRFCNMGWVRIGQGAMIADHVQVLSGRHQHGKDADGVWRDNAQQYEAITIGPGAWIGAGAVVMADVGPGAVVGAGAVVVKPVGRGQKVVGNPARVIE